MSFKDIVIDCNVLTKWFFKEAGSKEAEVLYHDAKSGKVRLYSPAILELEFLGVLTRFNKLNKIKSNLLEEYYNSFTDLCEDEIINLVSLKTERGKVLKMSLLNDVRYFDAEYLYLSKVLNAELITFDKELKKIKI